MHVSLSDPEVVEALTAPPSSTTTSGGVQIPYPFPSPGDWRDHWIYFLMVDRFNNRQAPPRGPDPWNGYQGGTLKGIRERLPYLKGLGAGALWLSPVLYNPQWFSDYWGGYGITDLLRVDPRLCEDPARADEEFRELVDEAHAQGLYVILDIVLNHLGDLFDYEGQQDAPPWKPFGDPYRVYWRDARGRPQGDWDAVEGIPEQAPEVGPWPHELRRNDYFRRRGNRGGGASEALGDYDSFRELVTEYTGDGLGVFPVRNHLIRAYQYLIARFDLDGFRIDTLKHIEPEFARVFGNAIREYALSIGKRNFLTFGEVADEASEDQLARFIGRNASKDEEFIGVDAALDFPMHRLLTDSCKATAPPCWLAWHTDYRRRVLKDIVSSHGDAGSHYVTFLDNHDHYARFHDPGQPERTRLALTCLMAMQGIPCVYYGTEQGLGGGGDRPEFVRQALWGQPEAFSTDHPHYRLLRELSDLRNRREPALRYGRQYFRTCSGNGSDFDHSPYCGGLIAFSRILNDREVLTVGNAGAVEVKAHVLVDYNLSPEGRPWQVVFSTQPDPQPPAPTATGPAGRSVQVSVKPQEAQVLVLA